MPKTPKNFNTQAFEYKEHENEEHLNKLRPRSSSTTSSSTPFDPKNTFLEAIELKSLLKRRIKGTNEIVFYYFKSIKILFTNYFPVNQFKT